MMMASPDPDRSEFSASDVSLRDVLTVVFKRQRLIAVFAGSVIGLVALVMLLLPPVYEVEATLMVNKARLEVPIAPQDQQQLYVGQVGEQELNSETEILGSRQLIEDVVDSLDLLQVSDVSQSPLQKLKAKIRRLMGRPELSFRDAMVVALQEELVIEPVRKSNVINVRYQSDDPDWATQVVGALTERYLDRRSKMYNSPQAVTFFEEQMIEAKEQLAEKEAALEALLASSGITMVKGPDGSDALAKQKDLIMGRLARVQNDLADAEVEIEESQHRISSLSARLAQEPERLQSSSRLNQDAAAEAVETALAQLELERDRLLQDFKPDSRYVRDIDTQIRLARERLADLQGVGGSIDGTELNPVYQELLSEQLRAKSQLDGAQGRYQSLAVQVADLETELENLNAKAFELGRLRRDADAAEESYLLYRKKHEEARISAAMDQQKLINVTVAQEAQKPLEPVPQRLALNLFLAFFVGVLGGVGLAFIVENYVDHSFATGEEMERRLGIPHLASIPEEA